MNESAWEGPLGLIRQWMIVRFALNTDRELWIWMFVVGVAAHLEYLAAAVLWVTDGKPDPFTEYQPKITLGRAARRIRERTLLDPATTSILEEVAVLRNSITHRGATYGVPFEEDDSSMGRYKGIHVFTEPDGLHKLMDDVDAGTEAIGTWLRQAGLGGGTA